MLNRQLLVTLLLLSLTFGSTPAASLLLSVDGDATQHSSDQPLKDCEEENEKSKSEWDELEVLFCGLFSEDLEQLPRIQTDRNDEPICLPQPVLSGPDHSRAPPAC